jgi:PKD repeat protein
VSITRPAPMKLHKNEAFTAHASEPVSSTHVTNYSWNWGDGHSTSTASATAQHKYAKAGTYTVSLVVTDSRYQVVAKKTTVTVGKKAAVHLHGPGTLHVGQKGSFSSRGTTDPNTGARIRTVTWRWGDGSKTTGATAKHKYAKNGSYTVTLTIADNAGVTTSVHKKVKVKR